MMSKQRIAILVSLMLAMPAAVVAVIEQLKQLLLCPRRATLGAEVVEDQQRRLANGLE